MKAAHAKAVGEKRSPFLPIGEPDFGQTDVLSIVFCGIAPGHVCGEEIGYRERAEKLGEELRYQLELDDKSRASNFWSEIRRVRAILRETSHTKVSIGWANILPIGDQGTARAPQSEDALRQTPLSEKIWNDPDDVQQCRRCRCDVPSRLV